MHEFGRENPPDFQAKFALNWSLFHSTACWERGDMSEREQKEPSVFLRAPESHLSSSLLGKFFSRESEYEGWLFLAKSSLTFCEQKKSTTFRKSFINTVIGLKES